uniref:Uncharacterized protein n=1 Tax=Macrostomum lignano TaxID=282301 RepID=A0A1I8IZ26_9PLAT
MDLLCQELGQDPVSVERIRKLPNVRLRNDADVGRLEHGQQLELPQPPLKRPRRGGSWQPELSLQPCDQQLLLAVRRCSRDVQNVLQGARLRVDRSCGVTDVAKADLQLIGQVVSDAFKRWREAYAELLSQLRCCCLHVGLLCWPIQRRTDLGSIVIVELNQIYCRDLQMCQAGSAAKTCCSGREKKQKRNRKQKKRLCQKEHRNLLIMTHHVSLPAAVLLSSLPSLAEASKTIRAQLVVCLFGCGIVSTKPTKAATRRAGFTNGLRRVWSPESAQCLAQATVDQEDEKEASSTSSSSTKHLVRQHLNPPVMEEDIREVCRHLGGAVLLSAAADSSTLSVLRLYRCSDFSDLPTAAWLIESSGNRQQTRVALEHSELSLPASTAHQRCPDCSTSPSSGLYYDPAASDGATSGFERRLRRRRRRWSVGGGGGGVERCDGSWRWSLEWAPAGVALRNAFQPAVVVQQKRRPLLDGSLPGGPFPLLLRPVHVVQNAAHPTDHQVDCGLTFFGLIDARSRLTEQN